MPTYSQELFDYIQTTCTDANVPGTAVIVTEDNRVIHEQMLGYRDVEKKYPVTAETMFGVASITKSFATLAIMQLAEKGALSVDDSVSTWIKGFKVSDPTFDEEIKIHHLMTHTAGFPGMEGVHLARMKSVENDPDGKRLFSLDPTQYDQRIDTVNDLVDWLAEADYDMLAKPGEMCNYSNESYALLQGIIEEASGEDVLTYMKRNVFEPLNMHDATFLVDDLKKAKDVTELYAYADGKEKAFEHSPVWWDVGGIYTNGSLKTTAEEITAYAQMYMNDGEYQGNEVLSKRSVEQMTRTYVHAPNENKYGYGLQITHENTVFGHGGAMKGVSSYFLVDKENRRTIVVLMNIAEAPAGDIAKGIQNYFVGEQEEIKPIDCPNLEQYVHTFRSKEGQTVKTFLHDGKLQMKGKWNDIELMPIKEDLFATKSGLKIAFLREEGNVSGVFSGMRYIPRVDE